MIAGLLGPRGEGSTPGTWRTREEQRRATVSSQTFLWERTVPLRCPGHCHSVSVATDSLITYIIPTAQSFPPWSRRGRSEWAQPDCSARPSSRTGKKDLSPSGRVTRHSCATTFFSLSDEPEWNGLSIPLRPHNKPPPRAAAELDGGPETGACLRPCPRSHAGPRTGRGMGRVRFRDAACDTQGTNSPGSAIVNTSDSSNQNEKEKSWWKRV